MPHWPGDPHTRITPAASHRTNAYQLSTLTIGEHSGTHIGAPRHFSEKGTSIDQLPVERLIVPAVKVDVVRQAAADCDYLMSADDLRALHPSPPAPGALLLIQTGWDRHWGEPARYLGVQDDGLHFPGISAAAVDYVAENWHVVGIGIDTAGIDGGQSTDFTSNRRCAQYGLYHLENLTGLDKVGDHALVFIGALAVTGGSGSPCRVIALLTQNSLE